MTLSDDIEKVKGQGQPTMIVVILWTRLSTAREPLILAKTYTNTSHMRATNWLGFKVMYLKVKFTEAFSGWNIYVAMQQNVSGEQGLITSPRTAVCKVPAWR